ncbi:MAG: hypothetical protein ACLUOF_06285 [Ruminococcus sp.]
MSSNNRTFLAMTIPIVILFFLFNTLPLITGAVYSFTNYRGYGSFDFVGLWNYIRLSTDVCRIPICSPLACHRRHDSD